MIPVNVVPWATWRSEHPDTKVLTYEKSYRLSSVNPFNACHGQQVAGVSLGDLAKAYPFKAVSQQVVVNDRMGDIPLMVYVDPDSRTMHVFLRVVEDGELEFQWVEGQVRDVKTGALWEPTKGFGIEGPLKGRLLREIPYSTAYDWDWEDFYPWLRAP
jgi:hypothetical protein